ncbi:MAG: glycosyltransferase [Butyrivibrio sp.]|nr:glycosyltransferase [Butyrivibrio sp.]
MSKIDVSVIVPAYNRANYINKCIDSVLRQKNVTAEIIIVDDGSTDSTPDICNEYAGMHSNIHVLHQINSGMASARNAALDIAAGDYITFLDSDDRLTEDSLIRMITAIKEYDVDAVMGEYDVVSDQGSIIGQGEIPGEFRSVVISEKEFWELNKNKQCNYLFTVVWGKLYKKEIWKDLQFGEGLRFAEDEYIMPSLIERCGKIYLLGEKVYEMTASSGSLTRSSFDNNKLTSPDSKLKTCRYLMQKSLFDCAVEKWGIAVGEVILMTRLVRDNDSKKTIKSLYDETIALGRKLLKYMDFHKKFKYLAYRIGYPFYRMILFAKSR